MSVNYTRINWEDSPSTQTPINAENLNAMDSAIDELAGAVNNLDGVPDDIDDLESEIGALKNDLNQKADKTEALSAYIVETATGSIASFSDGADGVPVKDLTVAIEPVQSGSGDPSPENVRPISGWTGANVTRMGKNLYDLSKQVIANGNTNTFLIIDLKHNTDYVFSTNKQIAGLYINYSDNETCPDATGIWSELDRAYSTTSLAFNSGSHKWYKLTTYEGSIQDRTYQLEFGSTASAYEPFVDSDTVSVDWTTEAGTVYGGTLDVTTGVLTVDRAMVDLGDQNWQYDTSTEHPSFWAYGLGTLIKPVPDNNTKGNIICTMYKTITANEGFSGTETIGACLNTSPRFIIYDPNYSSVSAFKTAVTGQKLVYELNTPQTFQLTAHEVSTILGQNNIWADCGNVTVQYRADTKLYIDKVVNA